MSFDEVRLRRNGSSVIQAMLKRLAEEEGREEVQEERQVDEIPLGLNTVQTVPVETAKPLTKAALY
jgi:Arc/MetJ-type ribon-helix-helix transcriptional regulator